MLRFLFGPLLRFDPDAPRSFYYRDAFHMDCFVTGHARFVQWFDDTPIRPQC